jgi:TonB family protein
VRKDRFSEGATVIVGFLEPPYDSFVRGVPAPNSSTDAAPPSIDICKAKAEVSNKVHVPKDVMMGLIAHRVQPRYPVSARQNHIEGLVTLSAVIDECGRVVEVQPISGPQELVEAAMTAVKQSEYRPYVASGQPKAVETELQVKFTLSH